jgi:hypothetical protein
MMGRNARRSSGTRPGILVQLATNILCNPRLTITAAWHQHGQIWGRMRQAAFRLSSPNRQPLRPRNVDWLWDGRRSWLPSSWHIFTHYLTAQRESVSFLLLEPALLGTRGRLSQSIFVCRRAEFEPAVDDFSQYHSGSSGQAPSTGASQKIGYESVQAYTLSGRICPKCKSRLKDPPGMFCR